ncbi:MAG: redox-sensing transcriptional repressor Rex [Pseudothermotoga sp.]|nr:redox-sensing transcriptional repressor Rex [Pseudothermotoga sp.]MDK2923960.1 redox-sensing transcriptional repressor [Pseudothermotoga sp.]HBT40140.1 redox-sensing transcriptional repressor Rex [Pseudothermotoga sp.]HCO98827.1 redox-sensing transcriptional repressor Rex [Pseudothermotoga sp.]
MDKVPKPVIRRLAVYLRCLSNLEEKGIKVVSSKQLASMLQIKDSQVRKDLSYFGNLGQRGLGYDVRKLSGKIREVLGLYKTWSVIILGAGNIGKALANHKRLEQNNFKIVAVFDSNERKINKQIAPGLKVRDVSELQQFVREHGVDIAVLAVPASVANDLACELEKAGVKGIVCFAPTTLSCSIPVEYVDITVFFKTLAHSIVNSSYNI